MPSGTKLVLLTGTISLLLLVLGVSGAWYVHKLQKSNSKILDVNVTSIKAALELETLVRETRHDLDRFLATVDRANLEAALEAVPKATSLSVQASRLSTPGSEEADLALKIRHGLEQLSAKLREVANHSEDSAIETLDSLVEGFLTKDVLAAAQRYVEINEDELQTSSRQNKALADALALALLLLGTCGAVAGLVAGYGAARGIRRSILQLSVPIRDVAGKLNEVVGPIAVSADPSVKDLETVLRRVSHEVSSVVEQLHARHREVIRADQLAAVGQLAAGLAHELRNPLMCMKVLVQSAARRGQLAALNPRDLEVLDEEITRLENLLQAFLDFARPAALKKSRVDLGDVVCRTVEFLSARAARRNVAVECVLPNNPLVVDADAAQLRQVTLNLLLNALDAVPNGGSIWVEVTLDRRAESEPEPIDQNQPRVRLKVSDNGRGLLALDRDRIYEPFFSTKETGLGLGLAITQRIVRAHGGQLNASDRGGGGAAFEVVLPVATPTVV